MPDFAEQDGSTVILGSTYAVRRKKGSASLIRHTDGLSQKVMIGHAARMSTFLLERTDEG